MNDLDQMIYRQQMVRWVPGKGSRARVCDRCTEKKVKCDMNRPRCSACDRSNHNCTFSRIRKRPGPPKGYQKQSTNIPEPEYSNEISPSAYDTSHDAHILQALPDGRFSSSAPDLPMHGIRIDSQGAPDPRNVYCSLIGSKSRSELTQFFNSTVNVCFPLFQRDTLLKVLELENTHPLPRVVHGISAKLIGDSDIGAESKADSELRQWVQWVHAQKTVADSVLDPKALYEWQTACLLTWYGFHQRLGTEDEMHMAISNLTRKAYRFGLHQIDSSGNRGCYGWDTLDEPKLEDWRRVWWCVYSLDSYSTFSTATPTQVEAESIQTALPLDPKVPSSQFSHSSGILLPTELHGLPAVTQDIRRGLVDKNFGLHMVVNSLLKEAVAVHRLSKQNPGVYISGRISALRDHLSALQLTLPPNYMRPTSDFIGGELLSGFNSRLQTQLKIHSIRVLLSISALRMDTSQWLSQWQENLEICFRMFEVIQQWDTQSSLTVDPAVCFIAASLLIMLHLHSLSSAGSTAILHAQLTRRKEVLRLFLQNYALYWRLPQFLLDCCDTFTNKVSGPLSVEDIFRVSDHLQGPLHQKWLNFLSQDPGTSEFLNMDNLINFDLDAAIENILSCPGTESVPI